MELRDDQTTQHEIGNRTYIVANVAPLDVDGVRTSEVGVAIWLVAFIALLPFYGALGRQRTHVVAVDLPGRLRHRPARGRVLPSAPQGARRAGRS